MGSYIFLWCYFRAKLVSLCYAVPQPLLQAGRKLTLSIQINEFAARQHATDDCNEVSLGVSGACIHSVSGACIRHPP